MACQMEFAGICKRCVHVVKFAVSLLFVKAILHVRGLYRLISNRKKIGLPTNQIDSDIIRQNGSLFSKLCRPTVNPYKPYWINTVVFNSYDSYRNHCESQYSSNELLVRKVRDSGVISSWIYRKIVSLNAMIIQKSV